MSTLAGVICAACLKPIDPAFDHIQHDGPRSYHAGCLARKRGRDTANSAPAAAAYAIPKNTDTTVAAAVGGLGLVLMLIGLVLPAYSGSPFSNNSIAQLDGTAAVVIVGLSLVVAWRIYRTWTNRQKPIWVLIPLLGVAWSLAADWSTTLYPAGADGSLDKSLAVQVHAGTGFYVIALGVLLAFVCGVVLWKSREVADTRPAVKSQAGTRHCEHCGAVALNAYCGNCGAKQPVRS